MSTKPTALAKWLLFFFSNYFWLGLVVILSAIIIDKYIPTKPFLYDVLVRTLESVGIAIVVASIFTFASGTSQFINKIQKLLQDIVVSRNFLGNIDIESKKQALESLLKPSTREEEIYSNIEDYYNVQIKEALTISEKCVRSNYYVHSRAYFDTEKKKVVVDGIYTYRLYPSKDGFGDVSVAFEEEEGDSTCEFIAVCNPDGTRKTYEHPELKALAERGQELKVTTIDLSEHGEGCNHLDIEARVREYGTDHWIMLTFKALQPTDGFNFLLRCDEPLQIRKTSVFVLDANFYVEERDDNKELAVSCNQWINEGSGLAVLVAIPHEMSNHSVPKEKDRSSNEVCPGSEALEAKIRGAARRRPCEESLVGIGKSVSEGP